MLGQQHITGLHTILEKDAGGITIQNDKLKKKQSSTSNQSKHHSSFTPFLWENCKAKPVDVF